MKKLWQRISLLGISSGEKNLYNRTLILGNQFNAIVFTASAVVLVFLTVMRHIESASFGIGSLRTLLVLILTVFNLVLSGRNHAWFSKMSLIFFPPVIITIFPTLIGFVEEESFAYYPYIIVAYSVLPPILLVPDREKPWYFISVVYFGLLLIFIEPFLEMFMPKEYPIVSIISNFFIYLKVTQIIIYILLQVAIYQLRMINLGFEQEITKKNNELSNQNVELNTLLQNLDDAQKKLYQSERMTSLGTLTAGMAHEINNPLNYIAGGLEILEEIKTCNDKNQETDHISDFTDGTQIIREGFEKTKTLVNALMTFTAKEKSIVEQVDLSVLIEDTILFMRHTFPEKLQIRKNNRLQGPILAYRDKLQQVLLSIIDNAVSAVKSKKNIGNEYISFEMYKDKSNYIILEIMNSGPEISENELPQIFDPFFTTKDPGLGTGLGLTIAYNFIKDHKGTLTAENTGEGVRFRIKFPVLLDAK